jgi:hypothetical protein
MNTKFKIDDKVKAKIFTHDARVFLRSLSDAITCSRQVSAMEANKDLYLTKISILDKTLKNKTLLLSKHCDHDICNVNLIASTSFNSYYNYFLMKFSVNLFLNFYDKIKEKNDFFSLSEEMDLIHNKLKIDLKNYIVQSKRKHFILTKDEV